MRVTNKKQVTTRQKIQEKPDIILTSQVEFIENYERVYPVGKKDPSLTGQRFKELRGGATVKISTDEILNLTRRTF